jgi:hypothetical protein
MSDLSDLHGIYATAIRWNAEIGSLAISTFNPEIGERELQEIELGKPATFVFDLATRARGYGMIKVGIYDMRLTPVSAPAPPWPGDVEFKPALGCWLWNPTVGEVRLETNASIFRQAISSVWVRACSKSEAAAGLQPVICFADRASMTIRALGKTFQSPIIKNIGWIERDKVPGWTSRAPTVAPPAALPLLTAASTPATPAAATPAKAKPAPDDDVPPWMS